MSFVQPFAELEEFIVDPEDLLQRIIVDVHWDAAKLNRIGALVIIPVVKSWAGHSRQ